MHLSRVQARLDGGEYLYVMPGLRQAGIVRSAAIENLTERHRAALARPATVLPFGPRGDFGPAVGVVLALDRGLPGRHELQLLARVLRSGRQAWVYWPREGAVERIDRDRLRSFWRHWWALNGAVPALNAVGLARAAARRMAPGLRWIYRGEFPVRRADLHARLQKLTSEAKPIPFQPALKTRAFWPATGVYLRTDFWCPIDSGGSYGHTCYVAKELAARSEHFVCFLPHRYVLLDQLGVRQIVTEPPPGSSRLDEDPIVMATDHYFPRLKVACEALAASFLYERLCLGNYAGAMLSQTLGIPYMVEYNGSEISMQRSFESTASPYEELYLEAERLAFKQATVISVVSDVIRDQLIERGVEASKIVVIPNGADLTAYAPAEDGERQALRRELQLRNDACLVGFTGTFGGWHGVEVLAKAVPQICASAADVDFLLIGDGSLKHVVDREVAVHGLQDRVRSVGRVPQAEGARLLRACDVFVSPHDRHMVGSRFFGSPTKLFEYMAIAGGIVASDLEQIGRVLSPALRPRDLQRAEVTVRDERAVLCTPGSVDELVEAVIGLAARPNVRQALGRNARQAVANEYSWARHVEKLWRFAAHHVADAGPPLAAAGMATPPEAYGRASATRLQTGDPYKDETQRQWDANPVGTQYVKGVEPRTLDWFLEIERYRFDTYAPWMREVMEFDRHAGKQVLEIGGGVGTDLAQFAKHGACVTDVDLSAGHLALAEENFRLRGLSGRFVHHDAESLPFEDDAFDVVYSNGVIHHTPDTVRIVREIRRVLKPGGRAIVMVYAENSLHYWWGVFWSTALKKGLLGQFSMGEIMSRSVEISANDARPLVKVYTRRRLRELFRDFSDVMIVQRQMEPYQLPAALRPQLPRIERFLGWNLIVKATKPIS